MKISFIKTIIVACIGVLFGLLCFVIADKDNYHNWVSFAMTAISTFVCLGSAMACNYNCGHRDVNIKVVAWLFSIIVILLNFIFSSFTNNSIVYIAIILLITVINIAVVNALYKPETKN